jgi:hypothetical protein
MCAEITCSAFQVHTSDNVATLLGEAGGGALVSVVGPAAGSVVEAREKIQMGHKIALAEIAEGAAVQKFGVAIGVATSRIAPGDWVHLHNCRSQLDEGSSALDLHTGVRKGAQHA